MNGTTKIDYKLHLLEVDDAQNLKNDSRQPRIWAASNVHTQAHQFVSSLQRGQCEAKEHDQISISEQAQERLLVEKAIKLETPPHITSVKEHVQELVRRTFGPIYKNSEHAAAQVTQQDENAEVFLPFRNSAEKITGGNAKTKALPVREKVLAAEAGTLPKPAPNATAGRPQNQSEIQAPDATVSSGVQTQPHNLIV